MRKTLALGLIVAAFCRASTAAVAQQLPPSVDPGRIERRLEAPQPERPPPPTLRTPPPDVAVPAAAARIRFVLRALAIEGAHAISEEELRAPYAELIGREISLARIFEAAAEMTARYRRAGFILSQVVAPAQEIRDGAVRLAAVEGFIGSVAVAGAEGAEKARIEDRLEPLLAERPLTAELLERQLLLINDLPGVRAQAVLTPSNAETGAADLILNVERVGVAGFATLDNRGADAVGPEQANFGVRLNSALGLGEQVALRAAFASPVRELRFAEADFELPVGASGAEIGLRASSARIEPGGELSRLEIEGTSRSAELALSYPLLRARAETLVLRGRFTARDSEADALGQPLSEDRLRVLALAADYDLVDRWRGVNLISFEAAQGLEALGASRAGDPLLSRASGRPDFSRINLTASRLQALGGGVALLAEASGQYAFSQLLASEEFGVGGARFGRAYEPSEITGDHGVAASLELRYGGEVGDPWLRDAQVYGFADLGAVWRIDDALAERRESLASAGFGVRFNVLDDVAAAVEVAFPLTATPAARDDRGPRAFFSLVRRF